MTSQLQGGSRQGASYRTCVSAGLALLLGTLAACGTSRSLEPSYDSPNAVAQAVVDGMSRKDVAELSRLAVTEDEFRDLVWPRQPGSRPERNLPWTYVWRDLAAKSRGQLLARVSEWPAQGRLTVEQVTFDGETTDYDTYRVFRASRLTLRDATGRLITARIFGSIIEQRGRFKVFSYVVD
jgi:hypothetical protein